MGLGLRQGGGRGPTSDETQAIKLMENLFICQHRPVAGENLVDADSIKQGQPYSAL